MIVTLHGTRGSVGRAGPATVRYGGDTSSVEVVSKGGWVVLLDAGSGIVHSRTSLDRPERVDIMLTHLHMDHIQGLGFFAPLFDPDVEVHIWGPVSTTSTLGERLARYMSPPLFPVRLRDLPSLVLHDLIPETFGIGPFTVTADLVIHPGPTLGYRIEEDGRTLTYLPDHEPALGVERFPIGPEWTSGFDLAADADLLVHDAQYTDEEYPTRVGWGHSSATHCLAFATLVGARRLVTFHHEPSHSDDLIDRIHRETRMSSDLPFELIEGFSGATFEV